MKRISLLMCLVFALATVGLAQEPKADKKSAEKTKEAKTEQKLTAKDYKEMLAKLKKGDTSINFVNFRLAYTETDDYSPYGGGELRGNMSKALGEKKYKDAIKHSDKMLKTNYCDLNAHYVAFVAHAELKNEEKSKFHRAVLDGLMKAILVNDGLTAETAMIAIGISEQYFVMSVLGYQRKSKGLVRENGSVFDVHTSVNREGKTRKFFFNIDKVFGRF